MVRHRYASQRTEEEKRNLKVNLAQMPIWQAELIDIMSIFERFDLGKVLSAVSLIQEINDKLFPFRGYSFQKKEDREKLEKWKRKLTIDRLVWLSDDYSAPDFLRTGVKDNIVEEIRSSFRKTEENLNECRARGITNSFWVSMFTSKVDTDTIRSIEQTKAEKQSLLSEIPKVEEALRLLSEILSESRQHSLRVAKLKDMLSLAGEKKAAIERFEAKHGKTFAKAAAADIHTRGRAASLRHLVKRTKECPYCGHDLGMSPHLDHIYPVSKGGLSIVENLVWCCSTCNGIKADKGLLQFLAERKVSIEEAVYRLHSLGKHI